MEMKHILKLTITKEEHEILKQAVDILTDVEIEFDTEDINKLQDRYEEELDYVPHTTALPTAIDYIGTLLDMAEIVEEKGEEENED